MIAIGLDQRAARGEASELFQQQAALAAAAEAQLADQLLVTGTASGGAADAARRSRSEGMRS